MKLFFVMTRIFFIIFLLFFLLHMTCLVWLRNSITFVEGIASSSRDVSCLLCRIKDSKITFHG